LKKIKALPDLIFTEIFLKEIKELFPQKKSFMKEHLIISISILKRKKLI
jgi:hypothetical protein